MRTVDQAGITLAHDTESEGYYVLTSWAKFKEGGIAPSGVYRRLSWYEAVDAIIAVMNDLRPGRDLDPGGYDAPLW